MEPVIEKILNEVKKVIIGKDEVLEKILMALISQGHVLLDDVPGTGKTTAALAFSRTLGLKYSRIQFTPDVLPSDITGYTVYDRNAGKYIYREGAVMTNLLLADEINRTSSKTQSALLEVMEERQTTVDGKTYKLPEPFTVIATQNPVGAAGTQLLPHAQLDRFTVKLKMGYPDHNSQIEILRDRQTRNSLSEIRQTATADDIIRMQQTAKLVHMSDKLLDYVTTLAEASRTHRLVTLGVSPRGALAVCRMAKARALVNGRDYAVPDDVSAIFSDVCAHRIILSAKAKINDTSAENILDEILSCVKRPDAI